MCCPRAAGASKQTRRSARLSVRFIVDASDGRSTGSVFWCEDELVMLALAVCTLIYGHIDQRSFGGGNSGGAKIGGGERRRFAPISATTCCTPAPLDRRSRVSADLQNTFAIRRRATTSRAANCERRPARASSRVSPLRSPRARARVYARCSSVDAQPQAVRAPARARARSSERVRRHAASRPPPFRSSSESECEASQTPTSEDSPRAAANARRMIRNEQKKTVVKTARASAGSRRRRRLWQ